MSVAAVRHQRIADFALYARVRLASEVEFVSEDIPWSKVTVILTSTRTREHFGPNLRPKRSGRRRLVGMLAMQAAPPY